MMIGEGHGPVAHPLDPPLQLINLPFEGLIWAYSGFVSSYQCWDKYSGQSI